MWLLTQNVIQLSYKGIRLNIPHPAAYGLHKFIIAAKRKNKEKQTKDREQAKTILGALSKSDRQMLKQIYQKLSKKEQKAIVSILKGEPLLNEFLELLLH